MSLFLNNLCALSSHRLILLVSYAGQEAEEEMALDVQPRRIYAIVQLSVLAGSFKVDSVKSVPYQSVSTMSFRTEHSTNTKAHRLRVRMLKCTLGCN